MFYYSVYIICSLLNRTNLTGRRLYCAQNKYEACRFRHDRRRSRYCFCLAAAVAARHDIYEKTPDYALRQIISSAESGDKTDFFEAVHDKDIAYAAFDSLTRRQQGDAVTAILELAGLPARENFASDIHILWEDALTGSNALDEDGGKAAEAGGILREFGFSVPLKGWYYDSHSFSKSIAAGKAEITVSLYNDRLKATLPCSIIMEKNADSWQITGLTDDIGFLTAVDKAYKKPWTRTIKMQYVKWNVSSQSGPSIHSLTRILQAAKPSCACNMHRPFRRGPLISKIFCAAIHCAAMRTKRCFMKRTCISPHIRTMPSLQASFS